MVIETRRSKSIIRFAQVVATIVLVYVTLQSVISAGENLVLFTRTNSSFSNDLNPSVLFHQTQILFNNFSKSPAAVEKKCMNPVQKQKTFSTNFSPFKITFNWTNLWFSKSLTSFSLEKNWNLKLGPSDNVVNKTDVDLLLKSLYPPFHHRKFFEKAACQRCVVVGNGPCLREKNLGPLIDQFPIVIRLNSGPIKGYEKEVGTKTNIRVLYPESAPSGKEYYSRKSFVVVVPYKQQDFRWAANLADPSLNLSFKLEGFWKPIPLKLPFVDAKRILVINSDVPQQLFYALANQRNKEGARATTGLVAIFMALHLCEAVSVAGFCFNLTSTSRESFAYYYGRETMMKFFHNEDHAISFENVLRTKLLEANLFDDLTNSMGLKIFD